MTACWNERRGFGGGGGHTIGGGGGACDAATRHHMYMHTHEQLNLSFPIHT